MKKVSEQQLGEGPFPLPVALVQIDWLLPLAVWSTWLLLWEPGWRLLGLRIGFIGWAVFLRSTNLRYLWDLPVRADRSREMDLHSPPLHHLGRPPGHLSGTFYEISDGENNFCRTFFFPEMQRCFFKLSEAVTLKTWVFESSLPLSQCCSVNQQETSLLPPTFASGPDNHLMRMTME